MTKIFKLNEIDCPICAAKAEKYAKKVNGVEEVSVDYITQKMIVDAESFSDEIIDELILAVKKVDPDCEVTEA